VFSSVHVSIYCLVPRLLSVNIIFHCSDKLACCYDGAVQRHAVCYWVPSCSDSFL